MGAGIGGIFSLIPALRAIRKRERRYLHPPDPAPHPSGPNLGSVSLSRHPIRARIGPRLKTSPNWPYFGNRAK